MIDALSHLPLFASADAARSFLDEAARDGVSDVICAGTDPRRDGDAFVLRAKMMPRVHRAFGVHPERASDEARTAQIDALERAIAAHGAVAVGECGLDQRDGQPPIGVQERTFRAQLAIARRLRLPVIVHVVGAWTRALDIVDEDGPLVDGGIWHGFAGPREAIARALRAGLALSVGGLVLNEHSRRLHEALPLIPAGSLVVETDMPHERALRLTDVVASTALLRGEARELVAERTAANARRVFRL